MLICILSQFHQDYCHGYLTAHRSLTRFLRRAPSLVRPQFSFSTNTVHSQHYLAEEHVSEVTTLSSQLIQSLSIIQGVVLNHEPSKQFLGRRFALEVCRSLSVITS